MLNIVLKGFKIITLKSINFTFSQKIDLIGAQHG